MTANLASYALVLDLREDAFDPAAAEPLLSLDTAGEIYNAQIST